MNRLDAVIDRDGSVRPILDTGFRMVPTESRPYIRRTNPPVKSLWAVDHLHVEDISDRRPTGLKGVEFITIDYRAVEARAMADIRDNIRRRKEREAQNDIV